ncbi:hypothetical protein [Tahibacter sp.]|uniref:hypothetical protein n=1 Tax=Tahibacter sp. TaxID=2056211 RepID=UPI0028C44B4F|nr:hypothetical protein [Tahibacter sp.]
MRSSIRCLALGFFALLLGACAASSTKKKDHFHNDVAASVQPDQISARWKELSDNKPAGFSNSDYVLIGFSLADSACNTYFDRLILASNKLRMSRADVVAVGTAAATIMSLAKSTARQIGIVAAAFGLGSTILDNTQQYLYITPYPEETRKLVEKAMSRYRESDQIKKVDSIAMADDLVAGYARLCTYSSITQLAKDAISGSRALDDSKPSSAATSDQKIVLQSAQTVLGLADKEITNTQWASITAISQLGDASAKRRKELLDALPDNIRKAIWLDDKPTENFLIVTPLLKSFASKNPQFSAMVEKLRDPTKSPGALQFDASSESTEKRQIVNPSYVRPHIVIDNR